MQTHTTRRVLILSILLMLGEIAVIPAALSEVYRIPKERDKDTVDTVLHQEIPRQYSDPTQPNCGYLKSMKDLDTLTTVKGVPLVDPAWPRTKKDPVTADKDRTFPENAKGLVFASYMQNDKCKDIRNNNPDIPCRKSANNDECQEFCDKVNDTDYQYCVDRISACAVYHYHEATDDQGNVTDSWCDLTDAGGNDTSNTPTDDTKDCNSCPESDGQCINLGWTSFATGWENVGQKYECTGNIDEENDQSPSGDGCGLLKVDYGWVGNPPANLPNACQGKWGVKEKIEHKNCMKCGVDGDFQGQGKECRTDPEHIAPPMDDAGNNPLNGSQYESFVRRYTATHTLADIPGTDTAKAEEEAITVNLACYDWYKENLDPRKPEDLKCIADDLQLETLQKRRVTPDNGEPNLSADDPDITPDDGEGPFSFDSLKKNTSQLMTDALTATASHLKLAEETKHPPFGETPKYVQVMENLERDMEGMPPTVEIILPLIHVKDELDSRLAQTSSSSEGKPPLTDLKVPLQPGLMEEVQSIFRASLLSRMQESVVPVAVPLASQSELQQAITAWQSWKNKREHADPALSADGADEIITKLQGYEEQIVKYDKMRAELPKAVAAVLDHRKKLTDAIDEWIQSRMAPYTQALATREKLQEFVAAWKRLKDAYTSLGLTNMPYCKNDATTPPLDWMELDKDFPPVDLRKSLEDGTVEQLPKHFVFDFSNIFFEGLEKSAPLQIPVFLPVQIKIDIPMPASETDPSESAPKLADLPDVPDLPAFDDKTKIQAQYDPEPAVETIPYDAVIEAFSERAADIEAVDKRYKTYLWVKDKHPDLDCPTFGQDGCVFPETRLWDVFMRIWSPVGAFLDQIEYSPIGSASPAPAVVPCKKDDEPCLLREKRVKRGLRITLPKETGGKSSVQGIRDRMRDKIIDEKGEILPKDPQLYDVPLSTDQLYPAFSVPKDIPLDFQSSSSSQ